MRRSSRRRPGRRRLLTSFNPFTVAESHASATTPCSAARLPRRPPSKAPAAARTSHRTECSAARVSPTSSFSTSGGCLRIQGRISRRSTTSTSPHDFLRSVRRLGARTCAAMASPFLGSVGPISLAVWVRRHHAFCAIRLDTIAFLRNEAVEVKLLSGASPRTVAAIAGDVARRDVSPITPIQQPRLPSVAQSPFPLSDIGSHPGGAVPDARASTKAGQTGRGRRRRAIRQQQGSGSPLKTGRRRSSAAALIRARPRECLVANAR